MEILDFITDITLIQALLLIAGIILVTIEMFYPGFGLPGILGGIMLLVGIILTAKTIPQAIILILIILTLLVISLTLVLRSAKRGNLSKTLILSQAQNKETGYIGTEIYENYLHKEGTAATVLRPAGTADFDGVKLDVVSEGAFIPAGKKVRVTKVEGRRIVVNEAESNSSDV